MQVTGTILTAIGAAILSFGNAAAQTDSAGTDAPYAITTDWQPTGIGEATVALSMHLDIAPEDAFARFVYDMADWYSRDWTKGQQSCLNMTVEPVPGGRWIEEYGSGWVQWAEVLQVQEGRFISFGVPSGTFWSGSGAIDVSFAPADGGGTDFTLTQRAFQAWSEEDGAAGYAEGWQKLVGDNFRRYCQGETIEDSIFNVPPEGVSPVRGVQ